MNDSKPTAPVEKPMWVPQKGDKVERLGAPLPRLVGTVDQVREMPEGGAEALIYWEWDDHPKWCRVSALTWHNPEAT